MKEMRMDVCSMAGDAQEIIAWKPFAKRPLLVPRHRIW
jgi:hypothetical protein